MPDLFIPKPTQQSDEPAQSQETPVSVPAPAPYEDPQPIEAQSAQTSGEPFGEDIPGTQKPPHNHPFASYCDHPSSIWFDTQEPDEIILLLLRKHIVTNIPWILSAVALLLIPPLLFWFATAQSFSLEFFALLPSQYITIIVLFYYLIMIGFILVCFITWYYTVCLVTQKKVVDIDYSDVIYHNVAATKMNLVQDVDYTQSGAIRSMFNYGDVFIQTASKSPNFDFLAVPNPTRVAQIIEGLIGKPASNS